MGVRALGSELGDPPSSFSSAETISVVKSSRLRFPGSTSGSGSSQLTSVNLGKLPHMYSPQSGLEEDEMS